MSSTSNLFLLEELDFPTFLKSFMLISIYECFCFPTSLFSTYGYCAFGPAFLLLKILIVEYDVPTISI